MRVSKGSGKYTPTPYGEQLRSLNDSCNPPLKFPNRLVFSQSPLAPSPRQLRSSASHARCLPSGGVRLGSRWPNTHGQRQRQKWTRAGLEAGGPPRRPRGSFLPSLVPLTCRCHLLAVPSHGLSSVCASLVTLPLKTPALLDWGPTLMTSFTLNHLYKGPRSQYSLSRSYGFNI